MNKTRRHVISIVLTAVLIATLLGTILGLGLTPKLGLDLRGGLALTLTGPEGTRSDVLDKTVEILRRRIDAAGVAEPEIAREGKNNISIQLPGSGDSRRLLDLIGRTAQLQFRQVQQTVTRGTPQFASATVTLADDPASSVVLLSKDGNEKLQLGPAELTGEVVKRGVAVIDQGGTGGVGGWQVQLAFTGEGARKWKEFTGKLACQQGDQRQIAIVLDQDVESHPQVATDVQCNEGIANGNTVITGNFTETEAKELALVLTTGALPVKLEQSEVRVVSPTLGKDSLRAGLLAGALGLALVFLYVLAYYRTLGLQTWLGLVAFSSIVYGLIVGFGALIGWNLTLAGIAGLIVSIGIATDSYIVFFERVKEEVHEGRTLPSSIDKGFKHAWRTMRTANMVTILAAVVLYLLTVGSVRGFALALGMATTIDLAVTYALTWPLASLLARSSFFGENKVFGMRRALEGNPTRKGGLLNKIYRSEFGVDFIGRRKIWLTISAVVMGLSVVMVLPGVRGLTYGIDFKGGNVFRAPVTNDLEADPIKSALGKEGVSGAVVQVLEDRVSKKRQVEVQTEADKDPAKNAIRRTQVADALSKVTGAPVHDIATDSVDKKWGAQITAKALRGLIVFLVLVILYMSWRLEPKMAVAGIVALLHDVLITIGVYALVGFEVSPATVIATLTILGYSLYDTVVVFDKIRENQALSVNARKSFGEIANDSTNQVLMRSINTSLTVLLPVGSLLFVGSALLGASTLKDLSLALFVGVAAGTYSSIFVATPLLSIWKEKEPRYQNIRAKILRPSESAAPEPVGVTPSGSADPLPPRSSPQVRPSGPRRKVPRAKRKKR